MSNIELTLTLEGTTFLETASIPFTATLRNTGSFEQNRYYLMNAPGAAGEQANEGPLYVGGFGSFHSDEIANFVLADGSARAIARSIDPDVFRLLGHRSDGEIMKRF